MRLPTLLILVGLVIVAGCRGYAENPPARFPDLADWVVEQMPGGTVRAEADALVIEDQGGCSVWYRRKLQAPVAIEYDVTVIAKGGPRDRVSDVNCFWMATDPKSPEGSPIAPGRSRSGRFPEYDSLRTYYVGMGGNTNTTTRFRRYDGSGAKPLLPEHDRSGKDVLLEGNRTYHIRVVARDGWAEYWRDGVKILSYRDPQPLTEGWFAFRTVKSHLEIRNFRVTKP